MRDNFLILPAQKDETARRPSLADPLDDASWDGLRWIVPLFTTLAGLGRHRKRHFEAPHRKRWQPARYTRSPFLMR